MKNELFLKSGYLNYQFILDLDLPFIFIVGGRGTGKTYGALKHAHDSKTRFMFMRRTQKQIKMLKKPAFNPFKKLSDNEGLNIDMLSSDEVTIIMEHLEESDEVLGYACAVSDIANMRGIDASDVDLLIYDEFIPLPNERVNRGEESGFLDIYESINRNRELDGENPLKVIALANSNEMANPIFMELNLVRDGERMKNKGKDIFIDKDRGVAIIYLDKSPISEKKKETALYKLLGSDSHYTRMSLANEFVIEDEDIIKSKPIKEYKPLVKIGELSIYKHKSRKEYYGTGFNSGGMPYINADSKGADKFRKSYMQLYYAYIDGRFIFEDYLSLKLYDKYMNL